jgi:pentatricopeptide repeat protein
MNNRKTEKAEQILRKMKKRGRRPSRPYQGPPDMDFLVQKTTAGTGEKVLREFNQSMLDDVGPWTGAG